MSGDDPPPPKVEPTSPYYIGYHDRPGDHITGTRLNLHNFAERKNDVQNALKARRKFVFLDGSITAPQSPCTKDDWETLHAMLIAWLMNLIEPEVKRMLSNYDNAKRLWDDLHDRFDVVDGSKIQHIKCDLHDCKQTENMSVAVYYDTLNQLWNELDTYEPIITCTCSTDVGKKHIDRRESDRLHQFLLGLIKPYETLRYVILAQSPLPTVSRAFQMVSQEERVKGIYKPAESAPLPELSTFSVCPSGPRPSPAPRASAQLSRS
ncbi:uncharacterized protein LOC141590654 [Silene latifolia]|uniref:uncharacterized protein LOC141590654 n=1 Tax=Silene latifolia TaxID=37657 RepID=UPI003D76A719